MMWHGDGAAWTAMWVVMALFWTAVVLGIVWFIRRDARNAPSRAEAILQERLAAGEIDHDEYRRLRLELSAGGGGNTVGVFVPLLLGAAVLLMLGSMAVSADRFGMWGHMMSSASDTSGDELVVGGMQNDIEIRNFRYSPGNLQVPVGATVTWTNFDGEFHDAVARDRSWGTQLLPRNQSESVTFSEPGEYEYFCTLHPRMRARIVIVE
jgi:plastocyanin